MHNDDIHRGEGQGRRRTLRRPTGLLAATLGLALLAAACSGGPARPGAGAGSPGSAKTGPLAYSQCMRAHGITDFPDPNPSGGVDINGSGNGGDLQPSNPKNQAAQKACQPILAAGRGTPAQQAKNYAAQLKYAACIRAHGIINFPDPKPPGSGPASESNSGSSQHGANGINPNSPQFIAANKACQHHLSGVPAEDQPGNSSSGNGAGS